MRCPSLTRPDIRAATRVSRHHAGSARLLPPAPSRSTPWGLRRTLIVLGLASGLAAVQVEPISLRNEHRLNFGELGSLSAGAVAARVTDPSSVWYNPGRLAQSFAPSISGSASIFESATTEIAAADDTYQESTVNAIPGYVGATGRLPGVKDNQIMWGFGIVVPLYWESSLENRNSQTVIYGPPNPGPYRLDTVGRVSAQSRLLVPAFALGTRITETSGLGLSLLFPIYDHRLERNTSEVSTTRGAYRSYWEIQEQRVASVRLGAGGYATWGPVAAAIAMKSPSWRLASTSTAEWHAVLSSFATGTTVTSDARIGDGRADFRSPFEATVAASYTGSRVTAELDLTYLAALGEFATVEGDLPIVTRRFNTVAATDITTLSVGTPGTIALTQALNVAVGLSWQMSTTVGLHAGYAIDHSQIADSNEFAAIDISTFSAGFLYTKQRNSVFVGFYHQWSTTGTASVFNSQTNANEDADVSISTLGLVLGGSYFLD